MERSVRALLAWLERDEAIATLLGRRPVPGEDTSAQAARWETARAALNERPVYSAATPTLEPLPGCLAIKAEAFVRRIDVQASVANLSWQLGIVDLEQVLGFQKTVVLDEIEERIGGVTQLDWDSLFTLCLPDPSPATEMRGFIDYGGKALTVSSLNPNLRVAGQITQDIPGQNTKVFGFGVGLPTSFVQVAEFKARWFLRDGYHRCFGLLRNGIRKIPCIFVKAKSFAETGAEQPGFLSYQILFGERPPFLADFLNDSLSVLVKQPAIRKVVRITAEEFVVEI